MFKKKQSAAVVLLTSLLLCGNGCSAQSTVVYRQGPVALDQSSAALDLNLDGVPDFRFSAGTLAGLPSPGLPSTSTPYLDTLRSIKMTT